MQDEMLLRTVWLHFVQLVELGRKISSLFVKRAQKGSHEDSISVFRDMKPHLDRKLRYECWEG